VLLTEPAAEAREEIEGEPEMDGRLLAEARVRERDWLWRALED
jgi:hypothetical protein